MQISSDVIGLKKSLSQTKQISQRTEPALLKPCPKMTKVSWIAIELKSSHGTLSWIAIELKTNRQHALRVSFFFRPGVSNLCPYTFIYRSSELLDIDV